MHILAVKHVRDFTTGLFVEGFASEFYFTFTFTEIGNDRSTDYFEADTAILATFPDNCADLKVSDLLKTETHLTYHIVKVLGISLIDIPIVAKSGLGQVLFQPVVYHQPINNAACGINEEDAPVVDIVNEQ